MGSGIFALGSSALLVNQAMMDTTSHNIANVNTPGYSRQQVELGTQEGQYTGAGFFGRGVKVQTVTRATNEFLVKQANLYSAQNASDTTRLDKLTQLEQTLPTGSAGLGYAANQLLNAFADVVNQPQDTAARQVVISRAQEFVNRVHVAGNQIVSLQEGVVSDTETTIGTINSLAKQIANLNDKIAVYQGSGHAANDLLDQRDQIIAQLNAQVQVNTVPADDGSVNVFMQGGQTLVLGNQPTTLKAIRDPNDSAQVRAAVEINGTLRTLDNTALGGGALHGLLAFQDNDLQPLRQQLNQYVSSFTNAVNTQQQLGYNSADPTQTPPPIFIQTADATTIAVNIAQPGDIAAASPLTASVPTNNAGTAAVNNLKMTSSYTSTAYPNMPMKVVFEGPANADGSLNYHVEDSTGSNLGTGAWNTPSDVNSRILKGPDPGGSTPLFKIAITGVPKPGDSITVEVTKYAGSNNGNAAAMLDLRDANIATIDGGSTISTPTNTYSQLIGSLGVMVQDGKTAASISTSLKTNADQTLSSVTGVNLDEEAARLMQYQQAYNASAKVLQIAQSLFDTLLQTARS